MTENQKRIEQLRSIPINAYTQEDYKLLEEAWIINGVWNNCLPKWLRYILTQLCFYLDFRIHDINYWKIELLEEDEREIKRKQADFGLLKYWFISPIKPIWKYTLSGIIIPDVLGLISVTIKFLLYFLTLPFVLIAYIAVRFWWKNSFN